MLIKVSQDHIDRGKGGDCNSCPIALAINDALDCAAAAVYSNTIFVWVKYDRIRIPSPTAVKQFIDEFDKRLPVSPFEFDLAVEESCSSR